MVLGAAPSAVRGCGFRFNLTEVQTLIANVCGRSTAEPMSAKYNPLHKIPIIQQNPVIPSAAKDLRRQPNRDQSVARDSHERSSPPIDANKRRSLAHAPTPKIFLQPHYFLACLSRTCILQSRTGSTKSTRASIALGGRLVKIEYVISSPPPPRADNL